MAPFDMLVEIAESSSDNILEYLDILYETDIYPSTREQIFDYLNKACISKSVGQKEIVEKIISKQAWWPDRCIVSLIDMLSKVYGPQYLLDNFLNRKASKIQIALAKFLPKEYLMYMAGTKDEFARSILEDRMSR